MTPRTKPKTKKRSTKKPKKAGNLRGRFVDEYMIHRNASKAAEAAGYSKRSAGSIGHRLMKDAEILSEINRREALLSASTMITAERIIQEYARLALLDPLDLFNSDGSMKALQDIPEDARRAIGGLELRELTPLETPAGLIAVQLRKVKLVDKKGALDSLAKIMGMMRERVDLNVQGGVLMIPAPVTPQGWEEAARASQAELKGEKVG